MVEGEVVKKKVNESEGKKGDKGSGKTTKGSLKGTETDRREIYNEK